MSRDRARPAASAASARPAARAPGTVRDVRDARADPPAAAGCVGAPGPVDLSRVDMGVNVHLDANGDPRFITRRYVVERGFGGYRLDHYLKRKIPRMSRTVLQRLIRDYLQPVRGRALVPHSPVAEGDVLVLRHPALPEPPCPRAFGVLYEDRAMMVVDKPAGLPVHASAKFYFNTLTRLLSERYPDAETQICHRLDRETSGALVVARGRGAAARLKAAFADKRVAKVYVALVHGNPPWPDGPLDDEPVRRGASRRRAAGGRSDDDEPVRRGASRRRAAGGRSDDDDGEDEGGHGDHGDDHVIDLPLGLVSSPHARIKIRMEVRADARPAVTRVRVIERRAHCALVRCVPVTGRQHQIRAHLAAAGFPIVGDKLYTHGDEVFAECCRVGPALTPALLDRLQLPRHALHAARVVVPHPEDGRPVAVSCPIPADMRNFVGRPLEPDPGPIAV